MAGKVAIVSGGAGSIGLAIGDRLAEAGCQLACLDIDGARLKQAAADRPAWAFLQADLADEADVDRAVDAVVERLGRVDYLVCATGVIGPTASVAESSLDDFDFVMRANVRSSFVTLRAVLGRMYAQGGPGAVVTLSSTAAARGRAGRSLYGMSKRAVVGMTLAAALESGERGIRVNCVAPGPIESEMYRTMMADASVAPTSGAVAATLGHPEDVAAMVAFLLSDDAKHCNGGVYFVDGGATA
jgi:NAD(P)-dependent dehydrogenase (short-subunit alcohol dehydrogenase family)